uniref:PBC domain-containing protein n=1 Tax=Timema genevievae TaxID=629358 RepID=A0A7R9K2N6_TIMGE|nr:unnamed protein product [Timema genevievae]
MQYTSDSLRHDVTSQPNSLTKRADHFKTNDQTEQKHTLNCHRMKPALFSVLCEIKEKTEDGATEEKGRGGHLGYSGKIMRMKVLFWNHRNCSSVFRNQGASSTSSAPNQLVEASSSVRCCLAKERSLSFDEAPSYRKMKVKSQVMSFQEKGWKQQ